MDEVQSGLIEQTHRKTHTHTHTLHGHANILTLVHTHKDITTLRNRCICLHVKANKYTQRRGFICTGTRAHARTHTHTHTCAHTHSYKYTCSCCFSPHLLLSCDSVVMFGPLGPGPARRLCCLRHNVCLRLQFIIAFVCSGHSFQLSDYTCECFYFIK